jgi:hypothetical protein
MLTPEKERALLEWLYRQYGSPYLWDAKGETLTVNGEKLRVFDCSGFVTCALVENGHPAECPHCHRSMRLAHNCHALWEELVPAAAGEPGLKLAFYGLVRATHVMFVMPDGRCYGAAGGNSDSTDASDSLRRGREVQFRSSPGYRPDLMGYRKLPL